MASPAKISSTSCSSTSLSFQTRIQLHLQTCTPVVMSLACLPCRHLRAHGFFLLLLLPCFLSSRLQSLPRSCTISKAPYRIHSFIHWLCALATTQTELDTPFGQFICHPTIPDFGTLQWLLTRRNRHSNGLQSLHGTGEYWQRRRCSPCSGCYQGIWRHRLGLQSLHCTG